MNPLCQTQDLQRSDGEGGQYIVRVAPGSNQTRYTRAEPAYQYQS